MLSTSIGNVGMLIVNEARRYEAEAKAWTPEAEVWTLEVEAEAWTLEAEAKTTISGLEVEARPRGLTSLIPHSVNENVVMVQKIMGIDYRHKEIKGWGVEDRHRGARK